MEWLIDNLIHLNTERVGGNFYPFWCHMDLTSANINSTDANLIALALDHYLCNTELPEETSERLYELLLEFDYVSDPESFLQHYSYYEYQQGISESYQQNVEKLVGKQANLLRVDFRKE